MKQKIFKLFQEFLLFGVLLFFLSNIFSLYRQANIKINDTICHDGSDIVYFWGSWCPICKMESPIVSSLAQKYQIQSVAVQSGDKRSVEDYMQHEGLKFDVIADQNGLLVSKLGVEVYPTLIYCHKKRAVFVESGFTSQWSIELKKFIIDLALF